MAIVISYPLAVLHVRRCLQTSGALGGSMWLTECNDVGEHHKHQTQLHAVLLDPVPHLKRQMQRLGLLVKEVLQHGEVHGGVEV